MMGDDVTVASELTSYSQKIHRRLGRRMNVPRIPPAQARRCSARVPGLRSLWWISLILMRLAPDREVTLGDSRRQRDEPSPAKVLADGSTCEKHCGCNGQGPAACAHA